MISKYIQLSPALSYFIIRKRLERLIYFAHLLQRMILVFKFIVSAISLLFIWRWFFDGSFFSSDKLKQLIVLHVST